MQAEKHCGDSAVDGVQRTEVIMCIECDRRETVPVKSNKQPALPPDWSWVYSNIAHRSLTCSSQCFLRWHKRR